MLLAPVRRSVYLPFVSPAPLRSGKICDWHLLPNGDKSTWNFTHFINYVKKNCCNEEHCHVQNIKYRHHSLFLFHLLLSFCFGNRDPMLEPYGLWLLCVLNSIFQSSILYHNRITIIIIMKSESSVWRWFGKKKKEKNFLQSKILNALINSVWLCAGSVKIHRFIWMDDDDLVSSAIEVFVFVKKEKNIIIFLVRKWSVYTIHYESWILDFGHHNRLLWWETHQILLLLEHLTVWVLLSLDRRQLEFDESKQTLMTIPRTFWETL